MIDLNNYPQRLGHVISKVVENSRVLLHLESGQHYALNEVGNQVWGLCDGTQRVEEIVAIICHGYEAPEAAVKADVLGLLQELVDEQLVLIKDSGEVTS